jgi:hypothetical protein
MKFLVILITTYMLLLVVTPGLALLPQKAHSCCKSGHCNMPKSTGDNCAAAGVCCTPFSGCGYCFGINLPPQGIKVATPPKNIHMPLAAVDRNFISDFLSDCFHPPEMV